MILDDDNILGKTIIKSIGGDVKGSKKEDIVYLVGEKDIMLKKAYYKNLEIIVLDGGTGKYTVIKLENNHGYNPYIQLDNFSGDSNNEILFVSDMGKSDGEINVEIYGFIGDKEIQLFSGKQFYTSSNYEVIYNDCYKVTILNYENNKKYILDISEKNKVYLDELYLNDKLKKQRKGKVSPINNIYTLKSNGNKAEILIIQNIIGLNDEDKLGVMLTRLKYTGGESFKNINTFVAEKGVPIEPNIEYRHIKEEIEINNLSIDFTSVDFFESERNRNYKIERCLEKEYNLIPGVDKFSYYYNKIDLNDDNRSEVIIYLEGPEFCEKNGGSVIVLSDFNEEYRVISKIKNVQTPIIISNESTNGYKNIIVKTKEKNKISFRILKFNGNSYPANPTDGYRFKKGSKIKGISLISDDLFYTTGIEYR
ncbi:hypothetical protein [Clostridium septicum]|uniref:VCBS repeat-containing protein n=1 Tax=Clostridium septicum TaxID=1504 RepID=A0A9N7JI80_CLOSE|nr:hypothetical protein [Clostridium septicum]AYE33044.1 hypothetical protein CP523_00550 [Clostridium septicum]MDU1313440.1 hypothetical protein [Clostridium septicum]QAS61213.1 hypothetical protein EI377_11040 [Clostridium septicum]UEC19437.1 hypothetical protein LK444_08345 [Clostridium septicum]USR99610.1 hypothetical protein NH397_08840 [Clostridium septicum]